MMRLDKARGRPNEKPRCGQLRGGFTDLKFDEAEKSPRAMNNTNSFCFDLNDHTVVIHRMQWP